MSNRGFERQILLLLGSGTDADIHRWLCHPGERCDDGCDASAIPARKAAYDEAVKKLDLEMEHTQ